MTDKKNPQTEPVDWAEMLKASMNASPAEADPPAPRAEEDDLAALLRAQLAHREQAAAAEAIEWDTSEFEEESDDTEDDRADSTIPAAAETDTADLPWDEDESDTDTTPAYTTEEAEDTAEARRASDTREAPDTYASPFKRGYTIEPVPYDPDEEEILSPDGNVGDIRLLAAEEESNRLLEELAAAEPVAEEEPLSETDDEPEAVAAPEAHTTPKTRKTEPAPRPVPNDPLQLGLDDVLPVVETLPPVEPKPAARPRPQGARTADGSDYTHRMAHRTPPREEAVRDAELYLRLGYEEQLTRSEQQEAVEEARRRARERMAATTRNDTAPKGIRREYTSREQTPAIERAYARSRRLAVARLLVATVGALFGILYDLYSVLAASVGAGGLTDSFLYPLLGVLWTVAFSLPFLSRLGKGLRSLFDFEPTRYAVSALAMAVAVMQGVVAVFTRSHDLYGGAALFMLAVAAATEYVTAAAEETSFSVVSSGKTSFVLTDETTPASAARAEQNSSERTLTAVRTGRVSDFFARTGRYNPYMGRLNYLLPVALLAAIACAGVAVLQGGFLLVEGVTVFTATYMTCLPAAYLVSMSLPLLAANRLLRRKGSAVLGTAAPTELCGKGSTRLLIRDGDAVGGLYRKEITLRDDPKAELWKRKAADLFGLLECPLRKESPLNDGTSEGLCVEVAETEEGYVRLFLIDTEGDETNEVMMGTREALTRRGIRLPKASMERLYKNSENSQVVYLAFDGVFRIAYAVEYRLGYTFTRMVEHLAALGDTAALVTYDPLVGDSILQVEPLKNSPSVEILRPGYAEATRKSCSAGVVATGRSADLLYPYAACCRMRRVYRLAHLISWLTLLLAMGVSLLTVYTGATMALSSAAVIAWQILLTAVTAVISLCGITRKSLFIPYDTKKPVGATKPAAPPSAKADTKKDKDQ